MAKLTITRTNQWTNRFRSVDIYMDNKKFGEISNNETKTFDIEAGEHVFFAQGDWITSEPVILNFNTDETKQLELGSPIKMSPFRAIGAVVLFMLLFGAIRFHDNRFFVAGFAVTIVVQGLDYLLTKQKPMIYYMTVGWKKYIYLRQV